MRVITTDIFHIFVLCHTLETCDDLKLLSHNCGPVRDQTGLYRLSLFIFQRCDVLGKNVSTVILFFFLLRESFRRAINAPFANGIAPSHRISDGFVAVLSSSCHTIFFQPFPRFHHV